jgi:hypothetical protein
MKIDRPDDGNLAVVIPYPSPGVQPPEPPPEVRVTRTLPLLPCGCAIDATAGPGMACDGMHQLPPGTLVREDQITRWIRYRVVQDGLLEHCDRGTWIRTDRVRPLPGRKVRP